MAPWAQAGMALPERSFALAARIQSPAVHSIAENQIEILLGKMLRELLQGGNDVPPRSVAAHFLVGFECPEYVLQKIFSFVMCSVVVTPDEQHALNGWVGKIAGDNYVFEHAPIGRVEGHR